MTESETEGDQVLTFQGSRFWTSNIWGAVFAGIGGGAVMVTLAIIAASGTGSPKVRLLMGGWVLFVLVGELAMFLGNGIAKFPYKVVIEKGKGLRLLIPFKEVYIPVENLRDVRPDVEGFLVRLKHRNRLLTGIVIHRLFGSQGPPLAEAIRKEIQRYASFQGHAS